MRTLIFILFLLPLTIIKAQAKFGPCNFTINLYPANFTTYAGSSIYFICGATPTNNLTYQWQIDNGSGFVNMVDTGSISGSSTNYLSFYLYSSWDNYWFRCILNDGNCSDTTPKNRINVLDVGVIKYNNNKTEFSIFPNPATSELRLIGLNETRAFYITDLYGKVLINGDIKENEYINITSLNTGVYSIVVSGYVPRRIIVTKNR